MWAENIMEIIRKRRGQVIPYKSRGFKNTYIVNNYMGPGMQIYAVLRVLCKESSFAI